jgi:Tfp pilus assembly protein PilZ
MTPREGKEAFSSLYFDSIEAAMESKEKSLQDPMVTHRLFELITSMSDDERCTLLKLLEKGLLKRKCRRAYLRKKIYLPVAYADERNVYRNFTRDISFGGVFILTSVPFEVGEEIRILFKADDKDGPLKFLGKISRVDSEGIGVRFISMNNNKKAAILSLASEV